MKFSKLLIVALVSISAFACKSEQKNQAKITDITTEELNTFENVQLVDVRTPEEYANGYIMDAVNINVKSDDFLSQVESLDKSKAVVVYCMAGVRSTSAAEKLVEAGFTNIYNYKGGFGEWRDKEQPITTND